ncbi:MAG: flippase [Candidatus Rokuibacteriota bacterium]
MRSAPPNRPASALGGDRADGAARPPSPFDQRVLRDSLLNLSGQALPLLVGVVSLPLILQGLGPDRFGILSLALAALGHFAILDFGVGRALTRSVAERFGRAPTEIPRLLWTGVMLQAVLGLLGAAAVAALAPLVVERVLNVPPALGAEAQATARLLALAVPGITLSMPFRGLLEGARRFDLLNAIAVPAGVGTYVLPLAGLLAGVSLPSIIASMVALRFLVLVLLVTVSLVTLPALRRSVAFAPAAAYRLLTFGGWLTVSNVAAVVLTGADRFLIAALLPVAMVTYYAAPYDLVTRLWIVSSSVVIAFFPAASALDPHRERERLQALLTDTVRRLVLVLLPIVLVLGFFAPEILAYWLGGDFATEGSTVLRLLAVGVLVNSLAQAPHTIVLASGRPDIPAKLHVLEVPLYCGLAWWLIHSHGIAGAAAAWLIRATLDAALMFLVARRLGAPGGPSRGSRNGRLAACLSAASPRHSPSP